MKILQIVALATVFAACSSSSSGLEGTGGAGQGGGSGTGGSGSGGSTGKGGSSGTGGASTGGSSAAGGSSASGGRAGSGGATATGGTTVTSVGGTIGTGGKTGSGGAVGGVDGGGKDATTDGGTGERPAKEAGVDGNAGSPDTNPGDFDPCPTSGDPCKILPLGDSITWGINYGGGYRIKLFTHAVNDQKNITFVGYDTANNADSTALSKLGSAKDKWVNKHEGHSGWTIQQDDDLVTGKSTATNDGVSYTGKKVVADFGPHIVLVHLGTNDMYQTPSGAQDRLGTLIDHIVKDAPNALVVVSNIIPLPMSASAVTTFNNAVPGVVKQRTDAGKHVIFADQYKGFSTSDLGSDQVHPNEGGYEKMAVVWYNAIKSYLH